MLLQGTAVADVPRDVITWHDNSYQRWAAFGTDTHLWAFCFDTQVLLRHHADRRAADPAARLCLAATASASTAMASMASAARPAARSALPAFSAKATDWWTMDTFGELLVVVPTQDGHLYSWDPTTPSVPRHAGAECTDRQPRRDRHRSAPGGAVWRRRRSARYRLVRPGGHDGLDGRCDQPGGDQGAGDQATALTAVQGRRGHHAVHHQRRASDELCRATVCLWHHPDRCRLRADLAACGGWRWLASSRGCRMQNFWLYNGTVQVLRLRCEELVLQQPQGRRRRAGCSARPIRSSPSCGGTGRMRTAAAARTTATSR